jgi:HEAT repeat protein
LQCRLEDEDSVIREAALGALGEIGDERAVEALVAVLEDEDSDVRYAAMGALGKIGDARAVEPLVARLEDEDSDVREAALGALLPTCRDEINRKILTRDLDSVEPFLDPQEEISEEWVRHAAEGLRISVEEVRQRYEALAQQFRLRLAWQPRAEQSTHSSGSEGKNI